MIKLENINKEAGRDSSDDDSPFFKKILGEVQLFRRKAALLLYKQLKIFTDKGGKIENGEKTM